MPRGLVQEEIDRDIELQLLERARDEGVVGQRDLRVEADRQQPLDLARIDLPKQLVGVHAGSWQLLLVDAPERGDVPPMVGIADVAAAGKLVALLAVFASALAVGLT